MEKVLILFSYPKPNPNPTGSNLTVQVLTLTITLTITVLTLSLSLSLTLGEGNGTYWLGEERGRRCDESWPRRAGGGVDGAGPPPRRALGVAAAEVEAAVEEEVAVDPGVGG